jgi:hypothetical protein
MSVEACIDSIACIALEKIHMKTILLVFNRDARLRDEFVHDND